MHFSGKFGKPEKSGKSGKAHFPEKFCQKHIEISFETNFILEFFGTTLQVVLFGT